MDVAVSALHDVDDRSSAATLIRQYPALVDHNYTRRWNVVDLAGFEISLLIDTYLGTLRSSSCI